MKNQISLAHNNYPIINTIFSNTPNESLINNNDFFSQLKNNEKIYLLHSTPKYEEIIKKGTLLSSGGCLVGSVYSTLLIKTTNDDFRMHNLGSYYHFKEAMTKSDKIVSLIIEIDMKNYRAESFEGVNYLKMGGIFYDNYKANKHLFTQEEVQDLYSYTVNSLEKTYNFYENFLYNSNSDQKDFFTTFKDTIQVQPIMGCIYFEAIQLFILLHQNDIVSELYKSLGEMYNWHIKELRQEFLKTYVKLETFSPSLEEIYNFIVNKNIVNHLDYDYFKGTINNYISDLIKQMLHYKPINDFSIKNIWDINDNQKELIGHIFYRRIRKLKRYSHLNRAFELPIAQKFWEYWDSKNLLIPFNGIIPKGEIGFNPSLISKTNYNIYLGENIIEKNGIFYISQGERVNIKILPKLVDVEFSSFRNQNIYFN